MDWHRSAEEKPKHGQPVLGYWKQSRSFLMAIHGPAGNWWCTTGGGLPEPTFWTIPEAPEV